MNSCLQLEMNFKGAIVLSHQPKDTLQVSYTFDRTPFISFTFPSDSTGIPRILQRSIEQTGLV